MLDLNHPQTPHIFAASRQEDLILDYCKRISLSNSAQRRFMLEVIRPAFAALRWLNSKRFGDSADIESAISELEQQAEKLTELSLIDTDDRMSFCPACGGKPTSPSKYDPVPSCLNCLTVIMPGLEKCRKRFGTEAI